MLAAVAMFSIMDVTMKHLVASYPSIQVTFLRGIASLPLLIVAAGIFGRWSDLIPHRWSLHLIRGLLSVLTLWCFIYSVKLLSLADAYTIFMSAPLLITALSVPLLGEHVGARRERIQPEGLFHQQCQAVDVQPEVNGLAVQVDLQRFVETEHRSLPSPSTSLITPSRSLPRMSSVAPLGRRT